MYEPKSPRPTAEGHMRRGAITLAASLVACLAIAVSSMALGLMPAQAWATGGSGRVAAGIGQGASSHTFPMTRVVAGPSTEAQTSTTQSGDTQSGGDAQSDGTSKPNLWGNDDESESGPRRQTIDCPEQGFSTLCLAGFEWTYREGVGVTIDIPNDYTTTWVRVSRMEDDPDFDPEAYFEGTWTPHMHDLLGSLLTDEGTFQSYRYGKRDMWGQEYTYTLSGGDITYMCLVWTDGQHVARFETNFNSDTRGGAVSILGDVVFFFKAYPEVEPQAIG